MSGDEPDPDELIDAAEVAGILGLAHRNSVSTYRTRYPDFPAGRPSPRGGRTLYWSRGDVLAWHESFRAHRHGPADGSPRLDELVAATARLMLRSGGTDVSIRQIAAEAGVAHSDLYRYATSKDQLQALAVQQINREFAEWIPATYDEFAPRLDEMITRLHALRPAMAVLASQLMSGSAPEPDFTLGVEVLAQVIADRRASDGVESPLSPEIVALSITALMWGVVLFGERWRGRLGLDEIPLDQVAVATRALLLA